MIVVLLLVPVHNVYEFDNSHNDKDCDGLGRSGYVVRSLHHRPPKQQR